MNLSPYPDFADFTDGNRLIHVIQTFGWLHPAARVRANSVRALLGEAPLLSPGEKAADNE